MGRVYGAEADTGRARGRTEMERGRHGETWVDTEQARRRHGADTGQAWGWHGGHEEGTGALDVIQRG